jgi:hypothetical protein
MGADLDGSARGVLDSRRMLTERGDLRRGGEMEAD